MANEYEIARSSGRCAATQRELREGEHYYVVLIETAEGFERQDLALEAWNGPPENCFCYWRARVPVKQERKGPITIDHGVLAHLFQRLENESSEMKQKFRFVLALLLMRKRLLRLERTEQEEGSEYWIMRMSGEDSPTRVLNPRLTAEEVERLSAQLTALLSGEVDPEEAVTNPDFGVAAAESESGQESESDQPAQTDEAAAVDAADAGPGAARMSGDGKEAAAD